MSMLIDAYRYSVPVPGSTWNPADKGGGVALSDSDLVATKAAAGFNIVRGVTGHTNGKRYAELVMTAGSSPLHWNVFLGIATPSQALTGQYLGQSAESYGIQCNDNSGVATNFARLFHNGAEINRVAAIALNSYARIAIDFGAGNGWIGNPAAWVGGGDPASGASPSFTFTPGTLFHLAAGLDGQGANAASRIRTGTSSITGSVPGGFVPWG